MVEYYKLSSLIKIEGVYRWDDTCKWEDTYLEINGDKSRIVTTNPQMLTGVSRQKLEKMTEEDVKKLFDDLHRDTGCVSCH